MGIQGVLFDLGGVIFVLGEMDYRREVARGLGLGDALPPYYEQQMEQLQRGEVGEQEVWEAISGRRLPLDSFDDAWKRYFIPVPAMLELAAELKGMGLRTAVLSNTQHSHVAVMQSLGVLDERFDSLLMSCEIGLRKPEPAAFQLALERMGLSADQVVFIDDVPEYVAAARAVGLHAILHAGDVEATRAAILSLI